MGSLLWSGKRWQTERNNQVSIGFLPTLDLPPQLQSWKNELGLYCAASQNVLIPLGYIDTPSPNNKKMNVHYFAGFDSYFDHPHSINSWKDIYICYFYQKKYVCRSFISSFALWLHALLPSIKKHISLTSSLSQAWPKFIVLAIMWPFFMHSF